MPVEEKIEMEGEITEALPNLMFRVKLDNDHEVLGHLAGKMRRYRIRVLPGDRVRVEISPYDLSRGRIVYRHKKADLHRHPALLDHQLVAIALGRPDAVAEQGDGDARRLALIRVFARQREQRAVETG